MTTGETIVFDDDKGFFHEVETPKNMSKKLSKGTVPDNERQVGGKSKKKVEIQEPLPIIKSDAAAQTDNSSESLWSAMYNDQLAEPFSECRPVICCPKRSETQEKLHIYCPRPEPREKKSRANYRNQEAEVHWIKSSDSEDSCSDNENQDVIRFRTESEAEIEKKMRPLMEKYGASYLAKKIMILGRKIEEECELKNRKIRNRSYPGYNIEACASEISLECKGILKKCKTDVKSPVKCPHCKKSDVFNMECKTGPVMNRRRNR